MALSLDATLATAQDSQSRQPIVEILSKPIVADIPFDGKLLTEESINEFGPNAITHSTGRLCKVYCYGPDGSNVYHVKYVYTNTGRQEFSFVDFALPSSSYTLYSVSLCELANGNIGIVWHEKLSSTYYVKYRIITVTGAAVSDGTIFSNATSVWLNAPFVITLADDSYMLVYVKQSGSDYNIYERASADFTSWGGEASITLTGLTTTNKKYNPSLVQISNDDIFLWFEYVNSVVDGIDITNIYRSIYSGSWATPVKETDYTTVATTGKHPIAVQKQENQMHVAYDEMSAVFWKDHNDENWCGTTDYGEFPVTGISYDSVNRKVYVKSQSTYSGSEFYSIIEIDVDTWEITNCWSCESTPAVNSYFCAVNIGTYAEHSEGHLVAIRAELFVALIDAEANTITQFNFKDSAPYGLTQNVTWPNLHAQAGNTRVWVDATNNRLYISATYHYLSTGHVWIGYIDLTDTIEPYTFVPIVDDAYVKSYGQGSGQLVIVPEQDMAIVTFPGASSTANLQIYILSTGALWKEYSGDDATGFPYRGIINCCYYDGCIYGNFDYEALYGEEDKRGLCKIELATDTVTFYRPTYASLNDYNFKEVIATGDGRILLTAFGYGVVDFNISDESWTLYNNSNVPGLSPNGSSWYVYPIAYDDADRLIFVGFTDEVFGSSCGIAMFSDGGQLEQSKYRIGTYSGSWSFGAQADLVLGFPNFNTAMTLDPDDNSIYAFWVNGRITAESSIKWDKESSEFDLTPYLVRDAGVARKTGIDGKPGTLTFECSEGHLFDPTNMSSLWSIYLAKFRRLTARFGETVSDTGYWQNQSTFYVIRNSLTYEKPRCPTIKVVAGDRRVMWEGLEIVATEFCDGIYPEVLLDEVLTAHSDMESADIDLPVFDTRVIVWQQWLDTALLSILTQVCNRFGYYPRMTVDGKFSARKISDQNAVDHTYSDTTKLLNYSPEDEFSDFTNQVTVQGEERTFIEVLYREERVVTSSGTFGWYGFKKNYTHYYSEDQSRRCRTPRLEVVESATSIAFELAGSVSEEISYEDPDDQYCVVTITAPNLTPLLIAGIDTLLIAMAMPPTIDGGESKASQVISYIGLMMCLNVLGAVGNFQYAIWARPVGKIRRSIQWAEPDEDLLNSLGFTVPKTFTDPLCTTVNQCRTVARQEILVAKMQRKRVRFSKIAHLQDEEGDTIRFPHPHTGINMDVFITDLTRELRVPTPGKQGYFIDKIEGWKV